MNAVVSNNELVLREIADLVEINNGRRMSLSNISKRLKKARISRKRFSHVPAERNSESNLETRAGYVAQISSFPQHHLIFLDEER